MGLRVAPQPAAGWEHSLVIGALSPNPDPSQLPSVRAACRAGRHPCSPPSPPPPLFAQLCLLPLFCCCPHLQQRSIGGKGCESFPSRDGAEMGCEEQRRKPRAEISSKHSKSRTSSPSKVAFLSHDMGKNAGKPELRFSAPLPREYHSETCPQRRDRGSLVPVCTKTSRSGALPPSQVSQ